VRIDRKHRGRTIDELDMAVGVSRKTLERTLEDLTAHGIVIRAGGRGQTLYDLSKSAWEMWGVLGPYLKA